MVWRDREKRCRTGGKPCGRELAMPWIARSPCCDASCPSNLHPAAHNPLVHPVHQLTRCTGYSIVQIRVKFDMVDQKTNNLQISKFILAKEAKTNKGAKEGKTNKQRFYIFLAHDLLFSMLIWLLVHPFIRELSEISGVLSNSKGNKYSQKPKLSWRNLNVK